MVAAVIFYILLSNEFNLVNEVNLIFEVLKNAPKQFYTTLLNSLCQAEHILVHFKSNLDLIYFFGLLQEFYPCAEIQNKIHDIMVQTIDVTPYMSLTSISRIHSSKSTVMKKEIQIYSIDQFLPFPPYSEIDQIKQATQSPSLPFVFIIPHPLTKEQKKLIDLKELTDDIGSIDVLDEEKINQWVEKRPASHHSTQKRPGTV